MPALLALTLCLPGCTRVQPSSGGERCAEDQPCAKGLRCSFKEKRCYKPVDCDVLAKRLKACTPELMETFSPAAKKLPAAKLATLLPRIQEHLRTAVVEHCRYDAAEQKRKTGVKSTKTKSWGEDAEADALNGCLAKGPCAELAKCLLGTAGVLGDRSKDPNYPAVFPLDLQRPATPQDAGAEDGPQGDGPARDAADMGAPAPDAPDTDAPAPDAPDMSAPPRDAPDMGAPARDGPARTAPARDAPSRIAPARDAPARTAPAMDAADMGGPGQGRSR
jgi:hypothetical protein